MYNRPSREVKERAVADVLAGDTIASVAERYNVSRPTVHRWRDNAVGTRDALSQDDQAEIGSLILRYARTTIETLIAQAELAAKPEWFNQQHANEVAIWAGVHVDKITRLLAAFQRVDSDT